MGGSDGVGVSVVNALSTRVEADIYRDGYEWFQTYDRSVPGSIKQGEKTTKTGTTIRFWADPNIFETTRYEFETVATRLREMAFLNKGLTITLTDDRLTESEVIDEVVSDTAEAPKSAEEKAAEQLKQSAEDLQKNAGDMQKGAEEMARSDIVPEAEAGLVPGQRFETWNVALEHAFKRTGTYLSISAEQLESDATRTIGLGRRRARDLELDALTRDCHIRRGQRDGGRILLAAVHARGIRRPCRAGQHPVAALWRAQRALCPVGHGGGLGAATGRQMGRGGGEGLGVPQGRRATAYQGTGYARRRHHHTQ